MDISNGGGWLKPSLLALFFWGLWGFLTKLGAEKVAGQTTMLFFGACTLLLGFFAGTGKIQMDIHHLYSLLAGVAGGLGFLFFFIALTRGPASAVIPLTSLYVAVASALAFIILSEPVTIQKVMGILCAVLAMFLLAG